MLPKPPKPRKPLHNLLLKPLRNQLNTVCQRNHGSRIENLYFLHLFPFVLLHPSLLSKNLPRSPLLLLRS
jgi:hypothetical protein